MDLAETNLSSRCSRRSFGASSHSLVGYGDNARDILHSIMALRTSHYPSIHNTDYLFVRRSHTSESFSLPLMKDSVEQARQVSRNQSAERAIRGSSERSISVRHLRNRLRVLRFHKNRTTTGITATIARIVTLRL